MRKTFLAQNQFNSDVHVPETSGSAAADSCPEPRAAAAQVSDGVGAKPILASSPSEAVAGFVSKPVAATLTHNPVTQAVEIRRPVLSVSSEPKLPAAAPTAQAAAGSLEMHPDEDEVLYLLLKLHDKPGTPDLPEIPDTHAFLNEVEPLDPFLHFLLTKKSAPRDRAGDPVWADAPPMFLQRVR